jgi:hypothetical protein
MATFWGGFSQTCQTIKQAVKTIPKVKLFITSDLAFQSMVFAKESMLGHWCMQCTMRMPCTLVQDQLNAVKRFLNQMAQL